MVLVIIRVAENKSYSSISWRQFILFPVTRVGCIYFYGKVTELFSGMCLNILSRKRIGIHRTPPTYGRQGGGI